MTITIQQLVSESYGTAKEKGWWEDENPNLPEKLMLMVSELSEVLEEYRAGRETTVIWYQDSMEYKGTAKPEGIPIEFADVLIRVADLCGHYGIDLEKAVELKLAYNKTRPYRHGGKKC